MVFKEFAMTFCICQLWTGEGAWRAYITIKESPSMEKELSFREATRDAARRAARASPYKGSQEGLICEQAKMIEPEWSLQTGT
jgi:hypothetical protein